MKVRYKKLGTIFRNHEIYPLEVPLGKLKTRVKIYYKHGLHHLKLKLLPVISTNFDGNFQSSLLKLISSICIVSDCGQVDQGVCLTYNRMMVQALPISKLSFRIFLEFLYILITFLNIKKSS